MRPYTGADAAAIAELRSSELPEYPIDAAQVAWEDACTRRAERPLWRQVRVDRGEVVGMVEARGPQSGVRDVRLCRVSVAAPFRARGLGRLLVDALVEQARSGRVAELLAPVNTRSVGHGFLDHLGWSCVHEEVEQRLDLGATTLEASAPPGIEAVPATSMAAPLLLALHDEVLGDAAPMAERDLADFVQDELGPPGRYARACLVALEGGRPVAFSEVWQTEASVQVRASGTVPSHRGRGIARWLKAQSLSIARRDGHPLVLTCVHVSNDEMLRLNRSLGFVDFGRVRTMCKRLGG